MKKVVEQTPHYIIYDINGIPSMTVSEDFMKKHEKKSLLRHYSGSDITIPVSGKVYSNFSIDVVFDKNVGNDNMYRIGGHSGDYGFNWPFVKNSKHELGKT